MKLYEHCLRRLLFFQLMLWVRIPTFYFHIAHIWCKKEEICLTEESSKLIRLVAWLVLCQLWCFPGTQVFSTTLNCGQRYNWNIVESGVKHHNWHKTNQATNLINLELSSVKHISSFLHQICAMWCNICILYFQLFYIINILEV
jgi:hypothetical protein